MGSNAYTVIAAVLTLVIAAIRRRLVMEIQAASLLVTGSSRPGLWLYSLFFLPGTLLHELSHWLTAEILLVPTGKLTILPDLEKEPGGGEQALGSVMTGRTGPFKSFLIGFAPFVTGTALLIILGYILNAWWGIAPFWQIALIVYGLVVVSNSMIVSRQDMRSWPVMAVFLVVIVFTFTRFRIEIPGTWSNVMGEVLLRIDQALGLTIGLNLVMIIGAFTLRRLLERVTKQKILVRR